MRRRVLMVHALPGRRGPARTLQALAGYVARDRDVVLAAPEGFLTSSLAGTSGIAVEPIPLCRTRTESWVRGSLRVARLVARRPRPEVIHANGLSALNLVALAALRHRIPVFVHFHHHTELGLRTRALTKLWVQLGVNVRISPVSNEALHVLRIAGLQASVGSILPNPVTLPVTAIAHEAHHPVRVGFMGSPSPRKGLHLLVQIAEGLAGEDLQWLIFGIDPRAGGRYMDTCRRRLTSAGLVDRVVWGGRVDDPDEAYRRMDVLLVPSLQESWCRVAMEGMAAGLPVVGTSIPGLSEVLELVPAAPTFATDRPDVGGEHIRRLAGDPHLRRAVGDRGREAVRRFEVERVGEQLLASYRHLADGARDDRKLIGSAAWSESENI